jgi:hypothetical protein
MTLLDLLFILFIILYATLDIIYILPTKIYKVVSPTCDLENNPTTFSNCTKYNVTNSPIYDIEHPTRDYAFSIYREDALLQFI